MSNRGNDLSFTVIAIAFGTLPIVIMAFAIFMR